jgi:choline dehydrogenase
MAATGPTATSAKASEFEQAFSPPAQRLYRLTRIPATSAVLVRLARAYGTAFVVMLPFSRGSVRLSSPEAGARPIVDPNYFGDDRDLRTMVTALRLARQIGAASAYDPWRLAEAAPGPAADDDDALRNFAKAAYQSYNHPVGTCAMGDTDMSVVDSELGVHGISGLRVADASVMPSIPSANTAATVYAIAEQAAELIGG